MGARGLRVLAVAERPLPTGADVDDTVDARCRWSASSPSGSAPGRGRRRGRGGARGRHRRGDADRRPSADGVLDRTPGRPRRVAAADGPRLARAARTADVGPTASSPASRRPTSCGSSRRISGAARSSPSRATASTTRRRCGARTSASPWAAPGPRRPGGGGDRAHGRRLRDDRGRDRGGRGSATTCASSSPSCSRRTSARSCSSRSPSSRGSGVPMSVVQVLTVNLVTDGLPAMRSRAIPPRPGRWSRRRGRWAGSSPASFSSRSGWPA